MSEPPEELTTAEEKAAWRILERALQQHCGKNSDLFHEKALSFIRVMELVAKRIRQNQAADFIDLSSLRGGKIRTRVP